MNSSVCALTPPPLATLPLCRPPESPLVESTAVARNDLGGSDAGRPVRRRRRLRRRGCRGGRKVKIFGGQNHPATSRGSGAQLTASGVGALPRRVERQSPEAANRTRPEEAMSRKRDELLLTSLDVQSLLPKILPLRREIQMSDTGTDIVILSETWLKPRVPNRLVTFPGYQLIRADRADGRGFGGVLILARDGFQLKKLPKPESENTTAKLETVWARVNIGRDRGIAICAAYRPPSPAGAQLTADLEQLESELQTVLAEHRGLLVLAGDLNCDLRVTTGNTPGGHLTSLLQRYSLSQTIRDPTYPGSGSLLDVIVTNCAGMVVQSSVHQCD